MPISEGLYNIECVGLLDEPTILSADQHSDLVVEPPKSRNAVPVEARTAPLRVERSGVEPVGHVVVRRPMHRLMGPARLAQYRTLCPWAQLTRRRCAGPDARATCNTRLLHRQRL